MILLLTFVFRILDICAEIEKLFHAMLSADKEHIDALKRALNEI